MSAARPVRRGAVALTTLGLVVALGTVGGAGSAQASGPDAAAAAAAGVTASRSVTAGSTRLGTAWQKYVVSPGTRNVAPVRVAEPTAGVSNPRGLLKAGGAPTVLTREAPAAPPSWPVGTTAEASSFHAPNTNNGEPRTYAAGNAIDNDLSTFWNDDTVAAYPDTLTVTAPGATSLDGVTMRSSSDGVPRDFTVETWDGDAWQVQATISGNTEVHRQIPFDHTVSTTRVRLNITKDTETTQGEYSRVTELYPGLVANPSDTVPSVIVDFGKVVVGYPVIHFAASSPSTDGKGPGVRLAFSESREYLTDVSDYSRSGPGTDQHVPATGGETWKDTKGCQFGDQVCSDGLHGFRYLKISLDAVSSDAAHAASSGTVAIDAVNLDFTAYLGTAKTFRGTFDSSDEKLNRIWYAAAYTNDLTTDHFRATDVDPRNAATNTLEGKLVLHDGPKRDRDPYVGDLAVQGRTEYLTHVAKQAPRNVLADLADHQRGDGFIPPASIGNYGLQLFDYPLWWVTSSWDYLLYTGDTAFAREYFPNLQRVLDSWYPSVTNSRGLLEKGLNGTGGYGDYAFLPRTGEVTYYNVNYVRALRNAAQIADSLHHPKAAARWRERATTVAAAVNKYLWDKAAGAYLDSGTGAVRHAQDGNSIAIVAGVADASRAKKALAHLDHTTRRPWGNSFMDNDTLFDGSSQRVYAFTSYPELEARFQTGRAKSALEEIRRAWGWMYTRDPGTTFWEGVGPRGSKYEGAFTSLAHGWSTGALPALTNYVLGVKPSTPGFARWSVQPMPGTLTWSKGMVPTPHGEVKVSWKRTAKGSFDLDMTAPKGTSGRVAVPTGGNKVTVRIDGQVAWATGHPKAYRAALSQGYVVLHGVGTGHHVITVRRAG